MLCCVYSVKWLFRYWLCCEYVFGCFWGGDEVVNLFFKIIIVFINICIDVISRKRLRIKVKFVILSGCWGYGEFERCLWGWFWGIGGIIIKIINYGFNKWYFSGIVWILYRY